MLDSNWWNTEATANPNWQKDNLEYDLVSTQWIIDKVKSDQVYAQHLYAALCNNDFTKNEAWPILTEKTWSCSWRHAGAVLSSMNMSGDYMDWYLSGILPSEIDANEFETASEDNKAKLLTLQSYVAEGVVTQEIRDDLHKLGWLVVTGNIKD